MKKLIIASIFTCCINANAQEPVPLYTGSICGNYYSIGSSLCDILDCEEQASNGSLDNLSIITKDKNALAIIQSDVLSKNLDKVRKIKGIYREAYTLVVRGDSDVTSFEDLKGKSINVDKINSGSYFAAENLMTIYNINFSDFKKVTYLPVKKGVEALCDKNIDAFLYVAAHPNVILQDAALDCNLKIIPINDDKTKKILATDDSFFATKIAKNTYPFVKEDIDTMGVEAIIVASKELTEKQYNKLKLQVIEEYNKLKLNKPLFNGIRLED